MQLPIGRRRSKPGGGYLQGEPGAAPRTHRARGAARNAGVLRSDTAEMPAARGDPAVVRSDIPWSSARKPAQREWWDRRADAAEPGSRAEVMRAVLARRAEQFGSSDTPAPRRRDKAEPPRAASPETRPWKGADLKGPAPREWSKPDLHFPAWAKVSLWSGRTKVFATAGAAVAAAALAISIWGVPWSGGGGNPGPTPGVSTSTAAPLTADQNKDPVTLTAAKQQIVKEFEDGVRARHPGDPQAVQKVIDTIRKEHKQPAIADALANPNTAFPTDQKTANYLSEITDLDSTAYAQRGPDYQAAAITALAGKALAEATGQLPPENVLRAAYQDMIALAAERANDRNPGTFDDPEQVAKDVVAAWTTGQKSVPTLKEKQLAKLRDYLAESQTSNNYAKSDKTPAALKDKAKAKFVRQKAFLAVDALLRGESIPPGGHSIGGF